MTEILRGLQQVSFYIVFFFNSICISAGLEIATDTVAFAT